MYEDDIKVDAVVADIVFCEPEDIDKRHLAITFDYQIEDENGQLRKRSITDYRYFGDNSLPYTEAALQTLGWDPIKNAWAIDELCDMKPIVGNEVSLVLRNETWQGKTRLKVRFINRRGGVVKDVASASAAASFAAQLRKKVGMSAPAATKRPAPKQQPPQRQQTADVGAVDSDGIPF